MWKCSFEISSSVAPGLRDTGQLSHVIYATQEDCKPYACWLIPSLLSESKASSQSTNPQMLMVTRMCKVARTGCPAEGMALRTSRQYSAPGPVSSVFPGLLSKQSYHFAPNWWKFFLVSYVSFAMSPVYIHGLVTTVWSFTVKLLFLFSKNSSLEVPILWISLLIWLWIYMIWGQYKQGNPSDFGQKDIMWKENKSFSCAEHMLNSLVKNFSFLIAWCL